MGSNKGLTKEQCEQIILKYDSNDYNSFTKENRKVRMRIYYKHWEDLIDNHFKNRKNGHPYFTYDELLTACNKCLYKSEFRTRYNQMYNFAANNNLLEKLFKEANFDNLLITKAESRFIYKYVFHFVGKKFAYVGLTKNIHKRDYSHRSGTDFSSVYHFAKKYNLEIPPMEIVLENVPEELAPIKEQETLDDLKSKGYIILNRVKCYSIGSKKKTVYSLDECIRVSRKYKNRTIWANSKDSYDRKVHAYCYREKLLDTIIPKK